MIAAPPPVAAASGLELPAAPGPAQTEPLLLFLVPRDVDARHAVPQVLADVRGLRASVGVPSVPAGPGEPTILLRLVPRGLGGLARGRLASAAPSPSPPTAAAATASPAATAPLVLAEPLRVGLLGTDALHTVPEGAADGGLGCVRQREPALRDGHGPHGRREVRVPGVLDGARECTAATRVRDVDEGDTVLEEGHTCPGAGGRSGTPPSLRCLHRTGTDRPSLRRRLRPLPLGEGPASLLRRGPMVPRSPPGNSSSTRNPNCLRSAPSSAAAAVADDPRSPP